MTRGQQSPHDRAQPGSQRRPLRLLPQFLRDLHRPIYPNQFIELVHVTEWALTKCPKT